MRGSRIWKRIFISTLAGWGYGVIVTLYVSGCTDAGRVCNGKKNKQMILSAIYDYARSRKDVFLEEITTDLSRCPDSDYDGMGFGRQMTGGINVSVSGYVITRQTKIGNELINVAIRISGDLNGAIVVQDVSVIKDTMVTQ